MWHTFDRRFDAGADEMAAPLYITGIRLCYTWQGIPLEKTMSGKLDTAASVTVIPIKTALEMHLPAAGKQGG